MIFELTTLLHPQYPDDVTADNPAKTNRENNGHSSVDPLDINTDELSAPAANRRQRFKVVRHPNGTLGLVILEELMDAKRPTPTSTDSTTTTTQLAHGSDIVFHNRFPADEDDDSVDANDVITMGQMMYGGAGKETTTDEQEQVICVNEGDGELSRLPRGN